METLIMIVGFAMIPIALLWSLIDFVLFLGWGGRRVFPGGHVLEVVVLVLPSMWLIFGGGIGSAENEWLELLVYLLMIACVLALFYSSYRDKLAPPVVEVIVILLLLAGIGLNIRVISRLWNTFLWIPGCVPLILQFVKMLIRNGGLIADQISRENGIPRVTISGVVEIPQENSGDTAALPGTGI